MQKLLIIGSCWPEPSSTAAGTRMIQLMEIFKEMELQITFCSAAQTTERSLDLKTMGVRCQQVELNNSSFDSFLKELMPDLVLYDRFFIEEQYGWRVHEICPNTIAYLDTEDLHFLRKTREAAVKKGMAWNDEMLHNDHTYREIASIHRCDLTLIISEFEIELLIDKFNIDKERLLYIPFLFRDQKLPQSSTYSETRDFMSIGNFMHSPNEDAVLQLKKNIWPSIREQIPTANLHIYGSYAKEKHFQWHKPSEGFLVHGAIDNVQDAFMGKRILLAPLRYGAGLKGKIFDAMQYGVPVCTSDIGAEGMYGDSAPNGLIAKKDQDFVDNAIKLYHDKELWTQLQQQGFKLLKERFNGYAFAKALQIKTSKRITDKELGTTSFGQKLLNYHSFRHSKFKSRWIEGKNR